METAKKLLTSVAAFSHDRKSARKTPPLVGSRTNPGRDAESENSQEPEGGAAASTSCSATLLPLLTSEHFIKPVQT